MKVLLVQPNDPVMVTCQDPDTREPRIILFSFVYKPGRTLQSQTPKGASFEKIERVFGLRIEEVQSSSSEGTLTCDFSQRKEGKT